MGLDRAQEKSMRQEGRGRTQLLKECNSPRHNTSQLKSNGSKTTSQIHLNFDPQSAS